MPAAIAIPLVMTAVSAGASIYQSSQANKRAKKAEKSIEDYERQNLENPYESLQVSTLAADRQREDLARTMSTYANLASAGGSRAISALAPNLIAQQNNQEAQITANLDEQEQRRSQMVAQGNAMRQQMVEQRENNDLLGLGNDLAIAQQQKADAQNNLMQSVIQGAGSVAMGAMSVNGTTPTAKQTPTQNTQTMVNQPQLPTNNNTALLPNSVSTFNFRPTYFNKGQQYTPPSWVLGLNGQYRGW